MEFLEKVQMSHSQAPAHSRSIDPLAWPESSLFQASCRQGLSVIYPYKTRSFADPFGWKYGPAKPPSYSAFGRMRSLLAWQDALSCQPQDVLEVAAGGGALAASLLAAGCNVTVNDLRADVLSTSLEEFQGGERARIFAGNLFDLSPQEIGKFDLVIACEIIEHVAHPDEMLLHLKRFLRPRGRILLTTPNGDYFRNKLPSFRELSNFEELEKVQFKPDADGHLFLFTITELCDLSAMTGLEIERLNLWATPFITGQAGARWLSKIVSTKSSYRLETLLQSLPTALLKKFCFSLSVILRTSGDKHS